MPNKISCTNSKFNRKIRQLPNADPFFHGNLMIRKPLNPTNERRNKFCRYRSEKRDRNSLDRDLNSDLGLPATKITNLTIASADQERNSRFHIRKRSLVIESNSNDISNKQKKTPKFLGKKKKLRSGFPSEISLKSSKKNPRIAKAYEKRRFWRGEREKNAGNVEISSHWQISWERKKRNRRKSRQRNTWVFWRSRRRETRVSISAFELK